MSDSPNSSVPSAISEFVSFYQKRLEELRFPDVDSEILRNSVSDVQQLADNVADAQQALNVARQQLESASNMLQELSARGLAYAQVYANGNGELSADIEALALTQQGKSRRASGKRSAEKAPKSRKKKRNAMSLPLGASDENDPKPSSIEQATLPPKGASLAAVEVVEADEMGTQEVLHEQAA